jgi:hypothetical protein
MSPQQQQPAWKQEVRPPDPPAGEEPKAGSEGSAGTPEEKKE